MNPEFKAGKRLEAPLFLYRLRAMKSWGRTKVKARQTVAGYVIAIIFGLLALPFAFLWLPLVAPGMDIKTGQGTLTFDLVFTLGILGLILGLLVGVILFCLPAVVLGFITLLTTHSTRLMWTTLVLALLAQAIAGMFGGPKFI